MNDPDKREIENTINSLVLEGLIVQKTRFQDGSRAMYQVLRFTDEGKKLVKSLFGSDPQEPPP